MLHLPVIRGFGIGLTTLSCRSTRWHLVPIAFVSLDTSALGSLSFDTSALGAVAFVSFDRRGLAVPLRPLRGRHSVLHTFVCFDTSTLSSPRPRVVRLVGVGLAPPSCRSTSWRWLRWLSSSQVLMAGHYCHWHVHPLGWLSSSSCWGGQQRPVWKSEG